MLYDKALCPYPLYFNSSHGDNDMICIVTRVPRIGLVCLLGLKPWDWNNARK
jgi:hypothetical protein